jgi:hypothetical protein
MANWETALKDANLNVEARPGWETNAASRYSFNPIGVMLHHTASNRNTGRTMPSRDIVQFGRKDLKGPLSQFLIGRDGAILLIAGGRCHHAGRGQTSVLNASMDDVLPPDNGEGAYDARKIGSFKGGNKYWVGIEIENDGIGEPYSDEVIDATIRTCAVLCQLHKWNPLTRVIMHREWTKRKIDPSSRIPWRRLIDGCMNGSFELPERDKETEQPEPFRVLKRGSRGPDVARIQKVLNLTADGIYGVITSQQVLLFQRKHNLTADGIVGKMTYSKLFEVQKRPILQRWPDVVL